MLDLTGEAVAEGARANISLRPAAPDQTRRDLVVRAFGAEDLTAHSAMLPNATIRQRLERLDKLEKFV